MIPLRTSHIYLSFPSIFLNIYQSSYWNHYSIRSLTTADRPGLLKKSWDIKNITLMITVNVNVTNPQIHSLSTESLHMSLCSGCQAKSTPRKQFSLHSKYLIILQAHPEAKLCKYYWPGKIERFCCNKFSLSYFFVTMSLI